MNSKKYSKSSNTTISDEDIAMRLAGKMINESVLCLQEKVLDSPVDGDVGAVFGLGFPPFHGGPFRFVDTYDASRFVRKLEDLTRTYGPRFKPCELLIEKATKKERFHNKQKYLIN